MQADGWKLLTLSSSLAAAADLSHYYTAQMAFCSGKGHARFRPEATVRAPSESVLLVQCSATTSEPTELSK
ncbi:MAG: hypothetical protein MJA27_22520 [Pseudanabaenales cyanobacterium]|nr:hypothetical protein [Pseudanabaenales cyanobacterium]